MKGDSMKKIRPASLKLAATVTVLVIFCVGFTQAEARPSVHGSSMGTCLATPKAMNPSYPGEKYIVSSNKLVKPAGKSQFAAGQLVYLSGHVYDENCVPLKGAKIELWQANPDGVYLLPDKGDFSNPYPLFAGTGLVLTDNEGKYGFVTLFPGRYQERAPHINLRVTHPDTKQLYVDMYFAGDARNLEDRFYDNVPEQLRNRIEADVEMVLPDDPNAGLLATFDITVKGHDPFRHF
jgi:protocatechuate 3,4-dioxygenase beta subunit